MNLSPDDPKLTAFALNELSHSERAAIEAELRESIVLQAELNQIRSIAEKISEQFTVEPPLHMNTFQRDAVMSASELKNIVPLPRRSKIPWAALTALAASIVALLLGQFWFNGAQKQQPQQIAMQPVIAPLPQPDNRPNQSTTAPVNAMDGKEAQSIIAKPSSPSKRTQPVIAEVEKINDFSKLASSRSGPVSKGQFGTGNTSGGIERSTVVLAPTASVPPQPTSLEVILAGNGSPEKNTTETLTVVPTETYGNGARYKLAIGDNNGVIAPATSAQPEVLYAGKRVEGKTQPSPQVYNFQGDDSGSIIVPREKDRDVPPLRYFRHRVIRPNPQPLRENTASYPHLADNPFNEVLREPLSTFSADVDGASYANIRRFLDSNQLPPRDAVRIEEMVNYFSYSYSQPHGEDPFSVNIEIAGCPWDESHRLARIGIKARDIAPSKRAAGNYVFLIDVSGSMEPAERLPLIKQALRHLVKKLNADDRVAIVVYANQAGVKLPSTSCSEKEKILEAIDELSADGSTNGGDGIQQAYRVARENFIHGGVNRVLLCTDGDFNVGITDPNELTRMIEERAKDGIFLTTLGVGTDNYKDALMQKLADKGNGNYYYLDTLEEAQRVLVEQMNSTLVTVAKDVKLQVEFNPTQVSAYRLVGYEKRALAKQDFNNDAKDAGEIGAGHTVTALYEIVPVGGDYPGAVDDLKYQTEQQVRRDSAVSRESFTVKLRYKHPEGDRSHLLEFPVMDSGANFAKASADFKFASAVAAFGMLLRDSEYRGNTTYRGVEELARESKGADQTGYRSEFINLVRKADSLTH